jgi:hypothetical protein
LVNAGATIEGETRNTGDRDDDREAEDEDISSIDSDANLDELLLEAVEAGRLNKVDQLLKRGAFEDASDSVSRMELLLHDLKISAFLFDEYYECIILIERRVLSM